MRTLDRIFGWLLIAGGAYFAFVGIRHPNVEGLTLLPTLGVAFAEVLLGGINLLRAERRHDLALARLCVFGNLGCLAITSLYARMLFPPLDPFLLLQVVVLGTLLALSMRSRRRSRPM